MNKVMIITWSDCTKDEAYLSRLHLLSEITKARSSISTVRLAFSDSRVNDAVSRQMGRPPLPNLMASIWSESLDDALEVCEDWSQVSEKNSVFGVSEKEPLPNKKFPVEVGERVHGFCQVAFLQRPERLKREEWLSIWQLSHTQVAIETQSTFGYRQNVIEDFYGDNDYLLHAIVEENFPPEAMTSDYAFYDVEDEIELEKRQERMMTSCARFIDFDRIDVVPMSEYLVKQV